MGEQTRRVWLSRVALAVCFWLAALAPVWAGPLWAANIESCTAEIGMDCPTQTLAVEPLSQENTTPQPISPAEERPCPNPVGEGVICRGPDVPASSTVYLPLVQG